MKNINLNEEKFFFKITPSLLYFSVKFIFISSTIIILLYCVNDVLKDNRYFINQFQNLILDTTSGFRKIPIKEIISDYDNDSFIIYKLDKQYNISEIRLSFFGNKFNEEIKVYFQKDDSWVLVKDDTNINDIYHIISIDKSNRFPTSSIKIDFVRAHPKDILNYILSISFHKPLR